MRRECLYYLIPVLGAVSIFSPCCLSDELSDVRAAWKDRNATVRSARITWTETLIIPKDALLEGDNPELQHVFDESLILEGEKIRVKSRSRKTNVATDAAFNGESLTGFSERPGQYPYAEIVKSDRFSGQQYNALQPLLWNLRMDEPAFKTVVSENAVAEPHRGQIDDIECIIIKDRVENSIREYWVAPSLGYNVLRQSVKFRDNLVSQIDVTYEVDATVGWAPKSWKSTFFAGGKLREISELLVQDFAVNADVDDGEFSVIFPVGAIVDDQIQGKQWLVREGDERRIILEHERRATYEQLKKTDSGKALLPPRD